MTCSDQEQAVAGFVSDERLPHRRLRLLCLHGHGSNSEITQMQVAYLQLAKKHAVKCDFLSATIEVGANDRTIAMLSKGPYYSWFNWSAVFGEIFGMGPGLDGGSLHTSLCRVLQHVAEHGPYDGVYGFSQGALMATLLSSETVWRGIGQLDRCPFRFAVLACAGGDLFLRTMRIATAPLKDAKGVPAASRAQLPVRIPSLHLIGARDWYRRSSLRLVSAYIEEGAVVYEHPYGHELPIALARDKALQDVLSRFLNGV